ncbi:MAG: hypothetical protein QNJ98_15540 [Planctomycetota bacterium]|nr:hypothetical protein [Planctomycetota bacterium]
MRLPWPVLLLLIPAIAIWFLANAEPELEPYIESQEDEEPEARPTTRRKRVRSTKTRPGPANYTDADLPDYVRESLEGLTRFQRRLAAGALYKRLQRDLRARNITPRNTAAAIIHLADTRLRVEGKSEALARMLAPEQPVPSSKRLYEVLELLTTPALDPGALPLFRKEEGEDALGSERLVRIWARDQARLSSSSIETGASLVRRLDRLAGVSLDGGYDVLHDATCGRDLFPHMRLPGNWIGVYLHPDRFCIVDATLSSTQWAPTLRHELVHAWQYAHCGAWSSRFLTEGIAEYLSHVHTRDETIEVPLSRLRDNFALLLRMIDRFQKLGKGFDEFDLQRLLTAKPWEFYMLGYFSYLVAQASIAYVDVETLKRSLWSGREDALWSAVHAMEWKALIAWVRKHAGGGVAGRAFVVGDRGQELPMLDPNAHRPKWAHRVLSRMGVDVKPSEALDALELADGDLIDNYAHVAQVINEVLAGPRDKPLTVICDVTSAMDEKRGPMARAPETDRRHLPVIQRDSTPRRYLDLLFVTALRRNRFQDLHLLAASDRVEATRRPLPRIGGALRAAAIPWWLRYGEPAKGPILVFTATAAGPTTKEETRIAALAHAMRELPEGIGPILVVDLGKEPGYGRDLAQAIYRAGRAAGVRVAYWHAAEAK